MDKTFQSRYFEDYHQGLKLRHAVPRTISAGDASLYIALTGARFALNAAAPFAQSLGFPKAPLDDMLVFHMAFGRTVPDLSLNAVANLGYAGCVFGAPMYEGDTVEAESVVTGTRQHSSGKTGTVYVHSTCRNHKGETVLSFHRWLMMRKRDPGSPPPEPSTPDLPSHTPAADFHIPQGLDLKAWNTELTGSLALWDDYSEGETIHHLDGQTIEEAEHQLATRLYQNNARVHFNQHVERHGRFGRRIVYGGHLISLARALSCNGLANAFRIAAIHAGRHSAPTFAGDTIYAWSMVTAKETLPRREDIGVLRLRTLAAKNDDVMKFPDSKDKDFPSSIVLDLDYSVLMPRRSL